MIDKKANKQLAKGLKNKIRKPGIFARYSRKRLISKLQVAFKQEKIVHLWLHQDLVSAIEKKPKVIVAYVEFPKKEDLNTANSIDAKMDAMFPKQKVNVIDVRILTPTIKEAVFKELTQMF